MSAISNQKRLVFSKFHDFHAPRLHHGETLSELKLFAQPMDRPEVLHAPRYDISGSWERAAAGEPSTTFPRGGLVETAGTHDYSELQRAI